jgi:hypothetical protein
MALADSLKHKIGPLPTWGWLGIATAGFGVFYFIEKKKSSSSSSTTTPTNTSSDTSGTTNPGGQGQVPQYVKVEQETSNETNSNDVNSNNSAPSNYSTAPVAVNSPGSNNTAPASPVTGTTPAPVAPTPAPVTSSKANIKIPNLVGQRAAYGVSAINALGLKVHTSPVRDPSKEYTVTGSSPPAGTSVAKGSSVTLDVKVLS